MPKLRRNGQQNKGKVNVLGAACLILAVVYALAYFSVFDNGIMSFAGKVQAYLLGKCALLLPLTLLLAAVQLLLFDKIYLLNKKTLAYFMVTLCLLGTAHHVFIPAGEELAPASLPVGGGLLGALIALGMHKIAGPDIGTVAVLAVLWLMTAILVLPLRRLHALVKKALLRDAADDKSARDIPDADSKQAEPRKNPFSGAVAGKAIRAGGGADAEGPQNIYNNDEFTAYTDGLQKPSSFKRFLDPKGTQTVYEKEPVKSDIEREPIQIPEWEEQKLEEREVVYRPVINYDDVPEELPVRSFLDFPAEPEPERVLYKEKEKHSVIYNEYREAKADFNTKSEDVSQEKPEKTTEPVSEERKVAIYDCAEKTLTQATENSSLIEEDIAETDASGYIFPPLGLLDLPKTTDPASYERDIMEQCAVLEQTLADFRVRAKVIAVTRGPSVTRFELEPAPGVKVSSVVNLADDIALRLAAPGVRIEAPIPGKSAIGIEAPNIKNDPVCFREVVDDAGVQQAESKLCIGLGKDISGNIITADLAKMPHLLVAGSTGSGKSVCINTLIAGLLYKASPEDVKLILVDPKVVELSNYNGIPHLLTPVVTEPKKAASALHWAVAEMERRYKQFAESHVREINSYNKQAAEKMPFIVIIIDELSDLMMVAKIDVEDAILRLAQKARAAGIHLILATQRPSVDVITGIVKANIPSRIAFAVSSQTDSRTIIDMGGAEKLLGKGDMLFYPIGFNKPVRVQGAFVNDAELNKIVDFIVRQSIPVEYSEEVTAQELECDSKHNAAETSDTGVPAEDELFEDALQLVLDMGSASSSMLQRRFRIGYTRAARLVDTMEELGIVGQSVGSKPREVIMPRQEVENRFLNND